MPLRSQVKATGDGDRPHEGGDIAGKAMLPTSRRPPGGTARCLLSIDPSCRCSRIHQPILSVADSHQKCPRGRGTRRGFGGFPGFELARLTKDGVSIWAPNVNLDNSSDIANVYKNRSNSYVVDGAAVQGWFSVDFTMRELGNVNLIRGVLSGTNRFDDDALPIITV
ncbi:hypothetical protein MLD38_024908 [Melastoma candidum]|uniref:Uncharacterized protein n=1 Tax=Melastoma candidum TaxID=119954 RepID=A0ACB9NTU9_9MYRT|nr:hypothetical protein MLD38_024908 [Melastoma candidum]